MPKPDEGKNAEDKGAKGAEGTDETIAALEKEVEKQKGIAENAEKLIQKWSAEQGEFRKEVASLKTTIEELKKAGTAAGGGKAEETAEEIEKTLTDGQRKMAESVFAQLSEADKIAYAENPEFRKSFLVRTRETVKAVPESPWMQPKQTQKPPDSLDKRIQELFEKQKRRGATLPTGPSRDQNAATGEGVERRERPARTSIGEAVLGR